MDFNVDIANFTFPYKPEKFSDKEKKVLLSFFTNVNLPVFAIHNLPQEVVGAMFSRYSRSKKSVRRLFLDEFWSVDGLGIQHLAKEESANDFQKANLRTKTFYQKVFAEYGDDSVIQMGSVHIAFEYVSQIAAKAIEDQRIGAAYIEKSTRYVSFDEKVRGQYLYMLDPNIMKSKYSKEYISWNDSLFDSYTKMLPKVFNFLKKTYPIKEQQFEDYSTGEKVRFTNIKDSQETQKATAAYQRALRAKTYDTVRVFLPSTTVTNLGAHFSGHAAENMVNKMISSKYPEVSMLGKLAFTELVKVSPNFLQNVGLKYGQVSRDYLSEMSTLHRKAAQSNKDKINSSGRAEVTLIDFDKDALEKIVSQIIFTGQVDQSKSKSRVKEWIKTLSKSQRIKIISSAIPDRHKSGINRRHKLPRAFEQAFAEVEFDLDFGVYRDLQRNRMSSTERQDLSPERAYVPPEFKQKGMKLVLNNYLKQLDNTKALYKKMKKETEELQDSLEYITLFGNKLRFNVRANLRQWIFFSELRTISGGHPTYRIAIQKATRQIIKALPFSQEYFAHVNWKRDYGLGRLKAEVKTQEKLAKVKN